jgi:hypothetical protein
MGAPGSTRGIDAHKNESPHREITSQAPHFERKSGLAGNRFCDRPPGIVTLLQRGALFFQLPTDRVRPAGELRCKGRLKPRAARPVGCPGAPIRDKLEWRSLEEFFGEGSAAAPFFQKNTGRGSRFAQKGHQLE